MALKCGIVGLPNVGKSTLFNCLSNAKAQSANFPFCTIEPNVGTITVPDERLNKLEELVSPEKVLPTTIEIVDIAGLVKGAHKGEGLGNQFLANIREVDAIIHVLRCFEDENVIHVDGKVDPVSDKEIIDLELQLKDLETIDKRVGALERKAKSGDKEATRTYDIYVPDERLNKLEELVSPEKVLPTTIEIVDIAGLVKGAHKGEGLGNQFLANIREVDAIIHVLRCFEDENVIHVDGKVDPVSDKEIIDLELQLKDLETIDKRVGALERKAKSGDKEATRTYDIYVKAKSHLESGNSIRSIELDEKDFLILSELQLITAKPVMYVCNVDENAVVNGNNFVNDVQENIKNEAAEILILGAGIEADISELDDFDERKMFLDDLGLKEPGVSKLIKKAYSLLNLQTYFTAGEKEVRAWTINKGMTAPQAAGVIHTDFEKGFIKAEVIAYNDYINFGSENAVKEAGKLMIQGKEYIVCDGDVMHFRFNV